MYIVQEHNESTTTRAHPRVHNPHQYNKNKNNNNNNNKPGIRAKILREYRNNGNNSPLVKRWKKACPSSTALRHIVPESSSIQTINVISTKSINCNTTATTTKDATANEASEIAKKANPGATRIFLKTFLHATKCR